MGKINVEEARKLREDGKTYEEIAAHFGVTRSAVWQALDEDVDDEKVRELYDEAVNEFGEPEPQKPPENFKPKSKESDDIDCPECGAIMLHIIGGKVDYFCENCRSGYNVRRS